MSLSISPDEIVVAEQETTEYERLRDDEQSARPAARFAILSRATFVGGVVLAVVLFAVGAWQRRWIADDGLIVLRTVRNLLAGNGPVFNMGERVEANTSTAWTYVVWFFSWLTQARLEYVVLGVALVASLLAIVFAMLGTARLWGGSTGQLLIPAGVLVYIALPPARDYATSGLESGLVICWVGLLWWLLIRWSQAAVVRVPSLLGLVFLAGLAPLIRPEATLIGALALGMIFLTPMPQFRYGPIVLRALIVFVAGIVPVAYQIWRMGYYGLPYPNTAVAKDAGGAKWGQGMKYLWDLVGPYYLWIPLLVLLIAGAVTAVARGVAVRPKWSVAGFRTWLRSPSAVVVLVLVSGLLLTVYAIRVGGDFMHGRMLLTQLFLLLLPVAVVPIRLRAFSPRDWSTVVVLAALLGTAGWSLYAASTTAIKTGTKISSSGIVDERVYYVLNTGKDHPILAEDYLDYPRMRAMVNDIAANPNGGLLLNSPAFTFWYLDPPPQPIPEGGAGHTVYFLNLGMTSMNVPLDVRVIDPMGLSYPLAAHSDRLADGRIGHDKSLYPDWVVVDSGMVDIHPWMPWYMDEEWVTQARTAMSCPETQALMISTRDPLTFDRFKHNLRHALSFAKYRIDRVPKYEIQRCGLVDPFPEPPR
ncbi:flagellar motor control protein ZomB [Nocardia rhizosphaerihabitans]|uniref:Terminal beta-(1->2)-arabinofuranosyltransferase n=1 Tax=Nocardia rhizosphaerihabitans TaxID=1691570 RepID=A0ABQ2KPR0_9NOCA|nr:flagellar motor control protein ZomB [Nocardia rhizosphaerihabitans]GGN88914.1 terminal beta-(1->2)-arabinofuranosyltransferase [Nocardia rhizosphaerihabitans]